MLFFELCDDIQVDVWVFFVEDVCPIFEGETGAFPVLEDVEEGVFIFYVAKVGLIDVVDGGDALICTALVDCGVCVDEGVFHEADDHV